MSVPMTPERVKAIWAKCDPDYGDRVTAEEVMALCEGQLAAWAERDEARRERDEARNRAKVVIMDRDAARYELMTLRGSAMRVEERLTAELDALRATFCDMCERAIAAGGFTGEGCINCANDALKARVEELANDWCQARIRADEAERQSRAGIDTHPAFRELRARAEALEKENQELRQKLDAACAESEEDFARAEAAEAEVKRLMDCMLWKEREKLAAEVERLKAARDDGPEYCPHGMCKGCCPVPPGGAT